MRCLVICSDDSSSKDCEITRIEADSDLAAHEHIHPQSFLLGKKNVLRVSLLDLDLADDDTSHFPSQMMENVSNFPSRIQT